MDKSRQTQRGGEIEWLWRIQNIPKKPVTKFHASMYLEVGEYHGILHEWLHRKETKLVLINTIIHFSNI